MEPSQILEIFDQPRYAQLAYESSALYQSNNPFPHVVFDNFLPEDVARTLSDEYPGLDKINEGFKFHDHQYASRHFLEDTRLFSPKLKLFAQAISSRSFLLFLETLTGIKALLPDPYFMGGGAMITGTGGFLNVHVDFNWHQKLQAWRRCNALFYLTPDWDKAWQGNLELWSRDGKTKEKEVVPLFNRMVVFSTTSFSYHGQPHPLLSPPETPRRVFSAFYYATEKDDSIDDHPHYTKYVGDRRADAAEFDNSPYAQGITDDFLKSVSK